MINKTCIKCGSQYQCKPYLKDRSKYCSHNCYHEDSKGRIPWNKGVKNSTNRPFTGWSIICKVCGKDKYYQLNEHKKRERVYCSPKCYQKDSRKEKLSYSGLHSRIKKDWGKAKLCQFCGSDFYVDWANISGDYLLDREDWLELCRKCHIHFDRNREEIFARRGADFLSLSR